MKKMIKVLSLVLALLMVAFCFTACGGDSGDKTTASGNNSVADNANNDNGQGDDTNDGESKGSVVVGYTIYKPMNYKDDSGKLVGYDTELAEKVFGNLGYKVIFREIQWDNKYTELKAGTIDCIWNGFTCNTKDDDGVARADKVDFSYNYMENRQVIVVKTNSAIKSAADLKGRIGVVESGSAGETYAKTLDKVVLKGATVQTDGLREVKAGTADFAVLDAQLAKSYCGIGDYSSLKILENVSSEVEYYAIGFEKGSELTALVNAELEKLGADGTIAALAEKYGVSNTAIKDFSDQKK